MSYETLNATGDAYLDALMRLWRDNMSDRRVPGVLEKRRRWLYMGNPAGTAVTTLVRYKPTGDIIGSATAYPRIFQVGDRLVKGGILADFVVDEDHRVAGPAIMAQRGVAKLALDEGFSFLCGYPNSGAAPIFLRLRYKKISDTTTWVKPLRAGPQLEKYVSPITARLAGLLLDRVLGVNDLRLALGRPRHMCPAQHSDLDARFDGLWDRGKRRHGVAPVRDANYLRWRAEHPTRPYQLFATERRDGTLHGYVAYRVVDRRVFVDDMFSDGDLSDDEALLLRFCGRMRQQGYVSVCVCYAGDERFLESLAALQFVRRPGLRPFLAFVDRSAEALRDVVQAASSWAMHDGELDI